ncbi:MAG: cation:proton antiporter [Myxococcales bacterium]|jgi:Kef-type K+ transport system membrane component KefB
MPSELSYIALIFALFVLPKVLQRFKIPSAITSLAIGLVCGLGFGAFVGDPTVKLLATFGIVALFVFAGLDADLEALRRGASLLVQHLSIRLAMLAGVTFITQKALGLELRPALVVALALLTPSTGFILESLHCFQLRPAEVFWVKAKAIGTEILALLALFVVLQSGSVLQLGLSAVALIGMVVGLPFVFRLYADRVAPFAPKSEFAFVMMVAVLAAYATRELGTYYLVGAFIVGMVAERFCKQAPSFSSESMLHAMEVFASFFVPFYFFSAGLRVKPSDLSWSSLLLGVLFLLTAMPLQVGAVALHRRLVLKEPFPRAVRVALSLSPTLIFTLVLAGILRERYQVPSFLFGGLVVYAVGSTMLPSILLRTAPPDFEDLHVPELQPAPEAGLAEVSEATGDLQGAVAPSALQPEPASGLVVPPEATADAAPAEQADLAPGKPNAA